MVYPAFCAILILTVKKTNKQRRKRIMKTALVIMAAGMGSRFGGGIKQLEPVGPNGRLLWIIPFMMQ